MGLEMVTIYFLNLCTFLYSIAVRKFALNLMSSDS